MGSAIVGGVLFAFSTFVLKALDRLPPSQSITAMQAINKAAPNIWFMTVLFGTALACVTLAVTAVIDWRKPGAIHRLVGGVLYLLAVAITVTYHVPHNDALATVDPAGIDVAHRWAAYLSGWTAWNHVRAISSIAGATILTLGLRAT